MKERENLGKADRRGYARSSVERVSRMYCSKGAKFDSSHCGSEARGLPSLFAAMKEIR